MKFLHYMKISHYTVRYFAHVTVCTHLITDIQPDEVYGGATVLGGETLPLPSGGEDGRRIGLPL